MKKSVCFAFTILCLASLAACNQEEKPNDASEEMKSALSLLKGNVDFAMTFENSREYDNPWYAGLYNVKRTFQLNSKFRFFDDNTYTYAEVNYGEVEEGKETEFLTAKGVYESQSGLVLNNYLTYDNKPELEFAINAANSNRVSAKGELFYNYFQDISFEDALKDEKGNLLATFNAPSLCELSDEFFSFYSSSATINFTLEDGKFTKFTIEYEPFRSHIISTSDFSGVEFTAKLSATGTITYAESNDLALKSKEGNKIAAIDNVLSKFDDNFTILYLNLSGDIGDEGLRVLYDGDRIAADVMDIFSDNGDLGTLSWLDAILCKDEAKNKYYVKNLSLDEETMTYSWKTNAEIVDGSATYDVAEDLLYYDAGAFDLGFKNIDSSLFTLQDEETQTYLLDTEATQYFGRAVVPLFLNYTAIPMSLTQFITPYTNSGVEWTLQIVDENTLRFNGKFSASFGLGAQSSSEWSFVFTNPGTTSVDAFYSDKLPEFEM